MKEITLRAIAENIPQATAFIDEQLEALDCSMKAQMQIDVAIDELFSNIVHYAYDNEPGDAALRFDFSPADRVASITFLDSGKPFNPVEYSDPDIHLSAEERTVGGLGIFLVRKTMDQMDYRYENGKNILTIHKHI